MALPNDKNETPVKKSRLFAAVAVLSLLAGHANIAAAQRNAAWNPTAITDALRAA